MGLVKDAFVEKATIRMYTVNESESPGDITINQHGRIDISSISKSIVGNGFANKSKGIRWILKAIEYKIFFVFYHDFLKSIEEYQRGMEIILSTMNEALYKNEEEISRLKQEMQDLKRDNTLK